MIYTVGKRDEYEFYRFGNEWKNRNFDKDRFP